MNVSFHKFTLSIRCQYGLDISVYSLLKTHHIRESSNLEAFSCYSLYIKTHHRHIDLKEAQEVK